MTATPLRHRLAPLLLAATLTGPAWTEELPAALKTFESWNQGAPVSQLAATRQAVFLGTDDPAVRAAHEAALLAFLTTGADTQAKQRVIGWLGTIAGDASVPAMAKLLADQDLASAACGALERIPGKAANNALLAALAHPRLDIIHSLGRRNDPANEAALLQLLKTYPDPQLRAAALAALASMDSRALRMFQARPELARAHGLALLRLADRARRAGDSREAAGIYRQVSEITDTLATESFLGLLACSGKNQDQVLSQALADKSLEMAAIRQIRAGDGSGDLLEDLVRQLAQDPAGTPPNLVRALAVRPGIRTDLRLVLASMIAQPGDLRLLAIDALAVAGGGDEAKLLLALAAGGPQADQADTAAFTALGLMEDATVDEVLQDIAAGDTDPACATTAIKLLGTRAGHSAASGLWAITRTADATRQAAAISALAASLPPEEFPALLDHFLASAGTPAATPAQAAVWDMLRRLPDQEPALRQVDAAAAKATPESAAALRQMTDRIRANNKPQPKPAPSPSVQLPGSDDRAALQPDGHIEALCLDAGTGSGTRGGDIVIRRLAGREYEYFGRAHALSTVDFGEKVAYELTGLDPAGTYVLGLTWWDADTNGRSQQIHIDGQPALPAAPPLAYHADKPTWSRLHLPVPASAVQDGKIELAISKVAGPNAVVSQVWLLRRDPASPARKRILIVTGDDYPGHRWRETGPEFAAILRADPRLEVTVSETPFILASPLLGHYDAVFLHFKNYDTRLPTGPALWTNLDRFVRDGGGLVVAHFGCGALQEWDGFVALGGRVWNPKLRGHDPYQEFLVHILNTSHPATTGIADFTTSDELYTCLDGDTPIDVLANATSTADQKKYPMAFTVRDTGQGRVFHCPLGHDTNALKSAGTRQLYQQGTAWAAGL